MKSLALLFSMMMILILTEASAQKLKKEHHNIKYFRAAKYPETISRYFTVDIQEKRAELDGSISEKNIHCVMGDKEDRTNFYTFNMNGTRQFHLTSKMQTENELDTISAINITAGILEIVSADPKSENIVDANNKVTGVKWYMAVTFNVPLSFKFTTEKGVVLIDYSKRSENMVSNFPGGYPKLNLGSYSSKDALLNAYNTNKGAYHIEIRDNFIRKWCKEMQLLVHHTFNDDEDIITLDFGRIKGKKGEFDDIDLLVDRLVGLVEKIQENFKLANKINWHTKEFQAEFNSLAIDFDNIMNADIESEKAGNPSRFEPIAFLGIAKNSLWCKFFAGKFDEVIEYCTTLAAQDAAGQGTFEAEMKIHWQNLLDIALIYKPIYENNKTRLNWY